MTEGKLVRDMIPDIIRESGRQAGVRYLTSGELVTALAAKLQEEAAEAAAAVDDREGLIVELADIGEVISALMARCHISQHEVDDAALRKAEARGRFESGAWLQSE